VIDIEVQAPAEVAVRLSDAVRFACEELGIARASVGVMVVDPARMAQINAEHRGRPSPTDVLSFPVDGPEVLGGWPEQGPAPELGDIVICPPEAEESLETLAVHGLLHLVGFDHETDNGEMLALQDQMMDRYAERAGT
jgi:probable rRNA maturation factor